MEPTTTRSSLERADVQLSYELAGQGPPILFIQGVGVTGEGWRPQVRGLQDRFQTLTFDNRGIGRSQPCRGPISIEAMAKDAHALVDAAGWESAHVVGHSMGGVIAHAQVGVLVGRDLADQPPILMKQLRAMGRHDALNRLPELRDIPTLVVSAESDRIALPQYGRTLAAAIPGARYEQIAAASHGVIFQKAEQINQLLAQFFDSL